MRAELLSWNWDARPTSDYAARRIFHAAVAEMFGARIMKTLGVGAPESVLILPVNAAQRFDRHRWIFKAVVAERLKLAPDADAKWVVAISKIPRAVTLSHLRNRYGVVSSKCDYRGFDPAKISDPLAKSLVDEYAHLGSDVFALSSEEQRQSLIAARREYMAQAKNPDAGPFLWEYAKTMLWTGKSDLPGADDFFGDFQLPTDLRKIKAAIAWNSPQMLRIHSARLFLAASTAHASNILTDCFGNLSTIDFELCLRTDGEDVRQLFANIVPRTTAFEALRSVAELTGEKICNIFDELPPLPFSWPLGSKEATVKHYVNRLHLWRELFQARITTSNESFSQNQKKRKATP